MHAILAYTVCMKQYTIRRIPDSIDKTAREKAKKTNQSLNSTLIQALSRGLGMSNNNIVYHDMDDLAGSWIADPDIEAALKEFDKIDEELWK